MHVVDSAIALTRSDAGPAGVGDAAGRCHQLDFLEKGHSLARSDRPRLRIQQTETGAVQALEIETLDGRFIRLAFRATALPEQLDGLAPGELTTEQTSTERAPLVAATQSGAHNGL